VDSPALPALQASGLVKRYGEGPVGVDELLAVDVQEARADILPCVVTAGNGITTLMQQVGALDRPSAGTLELRGRRYDDLGDAELTRLRGEVFGFVFQFFNLLPTLTAAENVLLPALISGRRAGAYAARVDELLARVGLADRAGHVPSELSGGEQQRVAIARALLREPQVLLADEPTGNLDSRSGHAVLELLRATADEGQTVVMVTHDPAAAARADRVVLLRDGQIVQELPGGDTGQVVDALRALEREPIGAPP
jgi:putative ABC transport system ATP-binding protein